MSDLQSITEIDVYQPHSAGGVYNPATDLGDPYSVSSDCKTLTALGAPVNGNYTLDKRLQIHPNESLLGVRMVYIDASPTPLVKIRVTQTVYNVVTLSPLFQ